MSDSAPKSRSWPVNVLRVLTLRDDPFWGKSWLRRLLRLPLSVLYTLGLLTLVLKPFENRLAYPGATFGRGWSEPESPLAVEDTYFDTSEGDKIHAWFTAPPGWTPERGAVLYSHGNAGNLSDRQPSTLRWRDTLGRAVLIYDYPGYGKSTGKPTEKRCYASADAAHDWLTQEKKVAAGEIVLLGSSMGGAFATDLASRRPCRMLVLVNTFTTFPDVAQSRFPFLPARYVVSNRLDSEAKLAEVHAPVFVTHGREDNVVPFWMGERLYEKANEPKRFYPRDGDGHRHPQRAEAFEEVKEFLRETE